MQGNVVNKGILMHGSGQDQVVVHEQDNDLACVGTKVYLIQDLVE